MSSIVALQPQRSIRDYSPAQLALIRQTVAKDTTPTEFDMFVTVCRNVGLDPFRRQIYCLVYSKDDDEKRKCVFITGIDGFRAVAARNRDYRPDDQEPEIVFDPDLKGSSNPLGIVKATVRVYKYGPDGKWYPCVGVAHWSEFAPMKKGDVEWVKTGEVYPVGHKKAGKDKYRPVSKDGAEAVPDGKWASMPHVMLAKCAEAQALRKGWPEDLSGIYAPEEMEQAMVDITPSAEIEQHEQDKRLRLVGATRSVPIIWKVGEPVVYVPAGKLYDEAAKHIAASDIGAELKWWWETNTAGFREFWAISKSDGLGVKQLYEARLKALEGVNHAALVSVGIAALTFAETNDGLDQWWKEKSSVDTHYQGASAERVRTPRGSGQIAPRQTRAARSDLQNRFLHALLRDLANQLPWPKDTGEIHSALWWKRRCTLQHLIDKGEQVEVVTSLDGSEHFGLLLPHTSDLNTAECAELAEWIIYFGSINGVRFSNPKWPADPASHAIPLREIER